MKIGELFCTVGEKDLQLPVLLLCEELQVFLTLFQEVLLIQHPLQAADRREGRRGFNRTDADAAGAVKRARN